MMAIYVVTWRRASGFRAKWACYTPQEVLDKVAELLLMEKVGKIVVKEV